MMKEKRLFKLIVTSMVLALVICFNSLVFANAEVPLKQPTGKIYLYGEYHGNEKILNKEFELWSKYYHEDNMRHLFIEMPCYTAEFLNLWMKADNDDILNEIYESWAGTPSYKECVKEFYQKIKKQCPETIFHGTDVGHGFDTIGQRFLNYLEENDMKDTEKYKLTLEVIEQGKTFYKDEDFVYRENKMVENFIREFDKLKDVNIMGIYGAAHTEFDGMEFTTQSVPCMANQLKKRYGDAIFSENLIWITKVVEPERVDTFFINGKKYKGSYFGKQDISEFKGYDYREFWRLENAYDDFKNNKKTGEVLPYENYPMLIETGQVFVIKYVKTDGSVERMYHRSDGYIWEGSPSTEGFMLK